MESFGGSGVIVEQANTSVQHPELTRRLLEIQLQYTGLANLVTKMERSEYAVTQAYSLQDVKGLNYGDNKFGGQELMISPIVSGSIEVDKKLTTFIEGTIQFLDFRLIHCLDNDTDLRNLGVSLKEGHERTLDYPITVHGVPCLTNDTDVLGVNASISAKNLGFVTLTFQDEESHDFYRDYSLGVRRPPPKPQDTVYIVGIMFLTALATFTFGLTLELERVAKYLKKPVAPAIGVACQFILMPLVGFAIASTMVNEHESLKLGIFASATAPGGGLSNLFIFVLNGDLDLSITMTSISTCAALAFLPLWMYTIGRYILQDSDVKLPFVNIVQALALLVVPLAIGALIKRFLPKVTKALLYIQKPAVVTTMCFIIGYGTWVNLYAFKLVFVDLTLTLCCFFLPYVGGIFGFLIALACQQGPKLSLTIGIETAVQNLNVAIILLRTSLPPPWGDISSAIPIVIVICTFAPFPFMAAGRLIYVLVKKNKKEKYDVTKEVAENPDEPDAEMKEGIDNPIPVTKEDFITI
ncbi:hepatic sodium/bile acid cotransporter-like [Watersipora subatra]|uniref:hepatic sodium/bile acid cotransporter-like n=1 Tax=Watersipora subatra TaxID=2589382 RepID=UPI00355C7D47